MLTSVMAARDWSQQIQDHPDDSQWLSRQEDTLYPVIQSSLYKPPAFHDAVELLMRVFPHYALVLFHVKRWSPLLLQALVQAQDLRDNEIQIRILTHIGEAYQTLDKNEAAYEAFQIALARAGEGQFKAMMLAAYIGLIRMQSVSMGDEYDPNLLTQALVLSHEIDDLALKAALHQSLSLANIHTRETVAAIEHGQIAYVYWHYLKNDLERAKTLYLLSAAYRFMWRLKQAEELLQKAAEGFENTSYNRQYTFLAYEAGALYLQRKEYEAATQWLMMALREASNIDYTALIISSQHGLGIAQTGLGQFDEAEANLQHAINGWQTIKNYRNYILDKPI